MADAPDLPETPDRSERSLLEEVLETVRRIERKELPFPLDLTGSSILSSSPITSAQTISEILGNSDIVDQIEPGFLAKLLAKKNTDED